MSDYREQAHEHLCVRDTVDGVSIITGEPRIMPGDAYCVRCSAQVPYTITLDADGKATAERVRVPCEDCGGEGRVGDTYYCGEFQPPERDKCPACDGNGFTLA